MGGEEKEKWSQKGRSTTWEGGGSRLKGGIKGRDNNVNYKGREESVRKRGINNGGRIE